MKQILEFEDSQDLFQNSRLIIEQNNIKYNIFQIINSILYNVEESCQY